MFGHGLENQDLSSEVLQQIDFLPLSFPGGPMWTLEVVDPKMPMET